MRRWSVMVALLALLAASCGDDGEGLSETTSAPAATDPTAPPEAPPDTEPPVPDPTAPPDAPPETEAPEGAVTDLAITEVVFGDHVAITNLGDATVSIEGLWLCNRPAYAPLSVSLAPGETELVPADTLGGLAAGGGEVGLYTSRSFDDSGAIVDYVSWGGGGGRISVAVEAGIWPDGDTVTGGGEAIVAPSGGASSSDWSSP